MHRRTIMSIVLAIAVLALIPGHGRAADKRSQVGAAMSMSEGWPVIGDYGASQRALDSNAVTEMPYSDFLAMVDKGGVRQVTIAGQDIIGKLSKGGQFSTVAPDDPGLIGRLIAHNVQISVRHERSQGAAAGAALNWLLLAMVAGVMIYFTRRMPRGSGEIAGLGTSRAKLLTDGTNVTFSDVAGIDEAKAELEEIVDFLKHPWKYGELGAKVPRGCLLAGPPGTGKTLLARAIAGEANVPFFHITGSDFVEMYVGLGARRVRDMFAQARERTPCIVFIDEIDAVGRRRGGGGARNEEREQTLNQLLAEMDGFAGNQAVIVIAATNRPDVLDPALLRPGRFDRQVVVSGPDIRGREKILDVHLRKVPSAQDVDVKVIARGTPGFSGADLANLVNEAALLAARHGKKHVAMAELEAAKDKVLMGAERRSMALTEAEKVATAYHEAGHALVAFHGPDQDRLHKVTIVPRGRALGVTISLPERDRHSYAKCELEAKLVMLFGGRVAEELIYGKDKITTGASDDLRRATELARRMVTEFGFSEKLGPLRYCEVDDEAFLGQAALQRANVSEATARIIDEEVRRVVEEAEAKARELLREHLDQLRRLAAALVEHETLVVAEIEALLQG